MALHVVRYGIPLALLVAGMVVTGTSGHLGIESGALFFSAASAVLLLNVLYRIGVEGDEERDTERSARDFFDQHGHWPDEPPSAARRRPQAWSAVNVLAGSIRQHAMAAAADTWRIGVGGQHP